MFITQSSLLKRLINLLMQFNMLIYWCVLHAAADRKRSLAKLVLTARIFRQMELKPLFFLLIFSIPVCCHSKADFPLIKNNKYINILQLKTHNRIHRFAKKKIKLFELFHLNKYFLQCALTPPDVTDCGKVKCELTVDEPIVFSHRKICTLY